VVPGLRGGGARLTCATQREHTVHRIADRLGRRPYLLNSSSHAGAVAAAALIDHDFAENGSVARRYEMQSDYWAPARVLCRQFSCPCGTCSVCSVIGPVFSAGSGETGVEEAL
jgi:hypothetical protein